MSDQNIEWQWLTINSFVQFTKGEVSESQIRWMLRFRNENGLSKHTKKIGKKMYLNKVGACEWINARNES